MDLALGLVDLLEPVDHEDDPEAPVRDRTAAEPLRWSGNTLYCFPFRNETRPIETGPTVRQDFGLVAIFVAPSAEESRSERDPEISALLDAKRAAYMELVRTHQTSLLWDHIQAAERQRPPRTLQTRAVAIEVTGYRIVGGA